VQYVLQAKNGPKKGIEGAVNVISDLTGVPINYYVETNFEGLQAMIDAVGGIEMNVPVAEKTDAGVIPAGTHLLDGKTVLALSRERHSVAGGDYGRQEMQLETLKGIAKASLKPGNLSKLPSLVSTASHYIVATNMSNTDMVSLGLAVKDIDPNKQLQYQQLKGTGKRMYDDVLRASNSQIVITPVEIETTIQRYFQS
jgi:anionic cell wall polymer biosynthesis LytR-Cps2A-Psr (LCP) family protein